MNVFESLEQHRARIIRGSDFANKTNENFFKAFDENFFGAKVFFRGSIERNNNSNKTKFPALAMRLRTCDASAVASTLGP